MKRLISMYDDEYYTRMKKVIESLGGRSLKYKWLITNIEAHPQDNGVLDKLIQDNREYLLLTTDELLDYLEIHDFQWIWGVFSAIPMQYGKSEILQYAFPYAENEALHQDEPIIQHPLAEIEIVASDASSFQVTALDEKILDKMQSTYKYLVREYFNFYSFISNDQRDSTAYYEFQFCKIDKPISHILGEEKFSHLEFWKEDSLCIEIDAFERFVDNFPVFLKTSAIQGGDKFNYYGPNYYSREMTVQILEEMKCVIQKTDNILIEWLERAASEFNGFYILGI